MSNVFTIDLGGTNTKYAIINKDGMIIEKGKEPTAKTLQAFVVFICRQLQSYANYSIEGIAISSPGAVTREGIIYGDSAIPYIHGPNMKELIEEQTNLPVFIENDANCAALSEIWQGSAKDKKDVVVFVLGTGVGGAIIKDGKIHEGANLHGGEFGYMIIDSSNLGNGMNTISEVSSTHSIRKRVAKARNVDIESLTGEGIFNDAEKGDEQCIQAIDEFYRMLAISCYNIQYTYDPELILLGGGISNREEMLERLKTEIDIVVKQIKAATITPNIAKCHFQADANLIGAVYNYLQN